MLISEQPNRNRAWFRAGPGVVLAAVIAAAMAAAGQLCGGTPADTGGDHIVWEADTNGHMRRVNWPTPGKPAALARLYKPEVGIIASSGSALGLSPVQRKRLKALNAAWLRDKTDILDRMTRSADGARAALANAAPARGASTAQIASGLTEYSALSAQYDRLRGDYWIEAKALLTERQRRGLAKLIETERR